MCTCTLGLIGPVPTVVLSITLPPRWDTASIFTLVLKIPGAAWDLSGSSCNTEQQFASDTAVPTERFRKISRRTEVTSLWFIQCVCVHRRCFPHGFITNTRRAECFLLTAVSLIRVIPAVIHAVTLPLQAHTHSVGTLEGVGVTHFAELGWRG